MPHQREGAHLVFGKCSVAGDIEAALRKIEYWHRGSIAKFKIIAGTVKDSGTQFDGTAKPCRFSL